MLHTILNCKGPIGVCASILGRSHDIDALRMRTESTTYLFFSTFAAQLPTQLRLIGSSVVHL